MNTVQARCCGWRLAMMLGATLLLSLGPTLVAAQSTGMRFPEVTGRNLEGRELRLPDDFESARTVVLIAFKRQQQRDVDSWLPELNARRAEDSGLEVFEIPTLSNGWSPLRWWIDGGMARGIKDQAVREVTVTLYIRKGPFKEALRIASERRIHLLLLDGDGIVRFRSEGPSTPEAVEALRRALADGK